MPVDLKRNSHEKQGTMLGTAVDNEPDDYAYGLSLHLEEPELQKVTITSEMVGTSINIEGIAHITSFSDGEDGKGATLQIRALGIKEEASEPSREGAMYDK